MAGEQPSIYTLVVQPGIKRDGTTFESREFTEGVWCRFQRGVPKKMGGYNELFRDASGIARGTIVNAYNGQNYIFAGDRRTIDAYITGTTFGNGSGPYEVDLLVGYASLPVLSSTSSSFTVAGDETARYAVGSKVVFDQTPGADQYEITAATFGGTDTVVDITPTTLSGSPSTVWLADAYFTPDEFNMWQFDIQYNPQGGALQVLAHPGHNLANIDNTIKTQVYVGDVVPSTGNSWTFTGLSDSEGANPTYQPIEVDGGVCVLYPFIFVYGSNGFIANNNVDAIYADQNFNDWNGPLANRVNMAAGKIVKGMPVRGGTNSPSGLFWATDSLIRVSFTGNSQQYWKYDIISSQTSIMSSNSVVEMDGIYYWMGVDRFYLYNGTVQVLANDKNINWVYDNLNFTQRQKVWATKVPRYNEIWFFYPRGNATECTDAIIYNAKDKIWYDAGEGVGARRSCGYTTEVFPSPVWFGWEYSSSYGQASIVIAAPEGYPLPADNQFYLSGNLTPSFAPGQMFQFIENDDADKYYVLSAVYDVDSNTTLITATEDFFVFPNPNVSVFPTFAGYSMWQHETGTDAITKDDVLAVPASMTTCDISWIGGDPSQDTGKGINQRMHLRRIEPDFLQSGDMTLQVVGRKFARGDEELSPVFTFGPNDGKVDLRIENREARIKFSSNTLGGNFEMGRLMVTAEYGDERP